MKKTTQKAARKYQHTAGARKSAVTQPEESKVSRSFPIVGLGASAGGLEALEQFLSHIPKQCGLGFVVVQHLDPTREGILVELLQRNAWWKSRWTLSIGLPVNYARPYWTT